MATVTVLTEKLWNTIAPLLPQHSPSPKGGRPRLPDRLCLQGILFVLRERRHWQSLPTELGWGSGSTCWRRFVAWTAAGVWEAAHVALVTALDKRGLLNLERAIVDSAALRAVRGGDHTGPNPTDRAKNGCKRHLITDAAGLPLVVQIGPANRRDEQWLPCLLWWLWIMLGYGRRRPLALQGDRGYASLCPSRWCWPEASVRCWRSVAAGTVVAWSGGVSWWSGRPVGSNTTGGWSVVMRPAGRSTKVFTNWQPVPFAPIACGLPISPQKTGSRFHRPL